MRPDAVVREFFLPRNGRLFGLGHREGHSASAEAQTVLDLLSRLPVRHRIHPPGGRLALMQATVIWSAATFRRFAFPTRHFYQSAWEDSKHSISISGEIGRANERRSQSQIT